MAPFCSHSKLYHYETLKNVFVRDQYTAPSEEISIENIKLSNH